MGSPCRVSPVPGSRNCPGSVRCGAWKEKAGANHRGVVSMKTVDQMSVSELLDKIEKLTDEGQEYLKCSPVSADNADNAIGCFDDIETYNQAVRDRIEKIRDSME